MYVSKCYQSQLMYSSSVQEDYKFYLGLDASVLPASYICGQLDHRILRLYKSNSHLGNNFSF